MQLKVGETVVIVALSNGLEEGRRGDIEALQRVLERFGLVVKKSHYLYRKETMFNGTGEEKAQELHKFWQDKQIVAVFDVSGGDAANGTLSYINWNIVSSTPKAFFGYSDLTVVVNALVTHGQFPFLYQPRFLIGDDYDKQQSQFYETFFQEEHSLFTFSYEWIQGNEMSGEIVGGNIRCLLKLAGTKQMPTFKNRILLLEAYGGDVAKMYTYLHQLKQLHVFEEVNGILLGTFIEMEETRAVPTIEELVKSIVGDKELPIARTSEIGHRSNSKCVPMGVFTTFKGNMLTYK